MLSGAFGDPVRIVTAFETGNTKDIATAIRPLTETLVATTPLILTGLGRRDLVPGGHVQHRRRRPAAVRRPRRDARGLHPRGPGARGGHPDRVGRHRDARRRLLGVRPGVPQGADGRPRGHHDDHAQLRRGPARLLRPAVGRAAATGQHGTGLQAHVRVRRRPADHRPARPSAWTTGSWSRC